MQTPRAPRVIFIGLILLIVGAVVSVVASPAAWAALINVPNDHATIQAAVDSAAAGDTVEVETGVYNERITFSTSGTAGNPIVLQAAAGHSPVIDGSGIAVGGITGLVYIEDQSYIHVVGFEIRNYQASGGSDFPAGIWVRGQADGIELRDNDVHDIENNGCGNCGAHGIAAYGTSAAGSINNILLDGNTVRDCVLGWSESVVLNGNVENFVVSNNTVHDNNNIGIDLIGFEGECVGCPDALDRARDGLVTGNLVYNIDSQGNPAYGSERSAGGIYVDGGTRIVIEKNTIDLSNIGVEIASEHNGKATSEIIVRNNFISNSHLTGIAMGGYDTNRGSTEDCVVVNNTLYHNDTDATGSGELLVQYDTRNNVIENNIMVAGAPNVFITNYYTANTGNVVDYNLYFSNGGAATSEWAWKDDFYDGFAAWQSGTGNDANSQFVDPQLVDPGSGDLHLTLGSPAVNAGDTLAAASIGTEDIDGDVRVDGVAVDVGADELAECGDSNVAASEECDDGNLIDGDGCDSNCTFTACGNGIITAGEICDDGNTANGDCCSSLCAFETAGSVCSDGEPCTVVDTCDGLGTCNGSAAPDPACVIPDPGSRGSSIKLTDKGSKDKLSWKWGRAPEVLIATLGDPTASDDVALCILVDNGSGPEVFMSALAPSGSGWELKAGTTLKYKDKALTPDGLKKVQIKAGAAGKAKAKVQGKGANLDISGLPLSPTATVTTELRNLTNGTCLGATYAAPFKRNEADRFQAQLD